MYEKNFHKTKPGGVAIDYLRDFIYKGLMLNYFEFDSYRKARRGMNMNVEQENKRIIEQNKSLQTENINLRQLIIEIKEIAQTGQEGFCPKCNHPIPCDDYNCSETAIGEILDKIKGVMNK